MLELNSREQIQINLSGRVTSQVIQALQVPVEVILYTKKAVRMIPKRDADARLPYGRSLYFLLCLFRELIYSWFY